MLLRRDGERLLPRIAMGLHLTLLLDDFTGAGGGALLVCSRATVGHGGVGQWTGDGRGGGVILALPRRCVRRALAVREWPALYACLAPIPVVVALLVLLVVTNFQDGVVYRQTWLPLVNPLEEGALVRTAGAGGLLSGGGSLLPALLAQARPWPAVAIMAFGFWWLNGALMRALAWYGDVAWNMASLWDSRLIQTTFALFWMLIALVVMVHATRGPPARSGSAGAVLLGS